jgi:hypothetical protein
MIVTRLNGGLGNQLFQYSFGRYLATKHQTELLLDARDYQNKPQHGLLLQHFDIEARFTSNDTLDKLPNTARSQSWRRMLWNISPSRLQWVREKPYGFKPEWKLIGSHAYLDGYWQSEQFFAEITPELRKQLKLKTSLSSTSQEIAAAMSGCRSVAIHIRRGDYITDASAAQIYHHLPLTYYQRCVEDWASDHSGVRVFVFSNDIPWCRKNLRLRFPITWIDHTKADTAYEDLYLMQQAECCITANSTLSWWGAWLGKRPGQIVYTPAQWFHPGTLNDQALACDGWVQMPHQTIDEAWTSQTSNAA